MRRPSDAFVKMSTNNALFDAFPLGTIHANYEVPCSDPST